MRENIKIGVIILAAGSSSRLGYPKQLVKFKGKFLLQHSIDLAEAIGFNTKILVLGSKAEKIRKEIDPKKFKVVINEHWEEGMGTSISKGISEAVEKEKQLEHILIMLSDQPLISKDKIEELIKVQLNSHKQATFSEYTGDIGVPAIFSHELFSELIKLNGVQGAKKLLYNKDIRFQTIRIENGKFDVDTKTDVEILNNMEEGSKNN